jgi:hypothetical protein
VPVPLSAAAIARKFTITRTCCRFSENDQGVAVNDAKNGSLECIGAREDREKNENNGSPLEHTSRMAALETRCSTTRSSGQSSAGP